MRRATAIFLSILLNAPVALGGKKAQAKHDWRAVEALAYGTPVVVRLWNGERIFAQVDRADDGQLEISAYRDPEMEDSYLRVIRRRDIRRVAQAPMPKELPDTGEWTKIGGIAGLAGGAIGGGIADATGAGNCRGGCWLAGGFVGWLGGMIGGAIASSAVGLRRILRRHGETVVYVAPARQTTPMQHPPAMK